MMPEYIRKEDVIKQLLEDWTPIDERFPMTLTIGNIKISLSLIDPADVEELRHGHWQPHPDPRITDWQVCSACGVGCPKHPTYHFLSCPNCRAIMDEVVSE